MTLVLENEPIVTEEIKTSDDPGAATHMVMVPKECKDESPQAYCLRARIEGFPVRAICGYEWIPTKDPEKFGICSKCLEIYHTPGKNRDDRDQLPDI